MNIFLTCLEMLGTLAFAASGAMVGIKKKMDIFGIAMLGVMTSVGGGVIRDIVLGVFPPATFRHPQYAVSAIAVSIIIFLPFVRKRADHSSPLFDKLLLIADSIGLGVFTVNGIKAAVDAGFGKNIFLLIFVGVITGVGGGVLRDIMAGERPYIFVKHIYACASLLGAVICILLYKLVGMETGMVVGCTAVFILRLCSAKFQWSLPKA